MPTSFEQPTINDVFVDAAMRTQAKMAVIAYQQDGILQPFPFDSSLVKRAKSDVPGFYEFSVSHTHAPSLPTIQAGVVVAETLNYARFISLTQHIQTRDHAIVRLKLQMAKNPHPLELPNTTIGLEISDPLDQTLKTMIMLSRAQTKENHLAIRAVRNGALQYPPTMIARKQPMLFDQQDLPDWGFSQSALAVLDAERALQLIRKWQYTLTDDMSTLTADEAVRHISLAVIDG